MGRPCSYKPEYCDMLIDHMNKGLSFISFAAKLKYSEDTLRRWLSEFPEFQEAKKIGEAQSLLFWEQLGIAGASGKLKNFNAAVWCFNMKNRFGWRDKHDVVTTGDSVVNHAYLVKLIQDSDAIAN